MFPTRTKTDAKIVSMDELRRIRQAVSIPIVAIGGISKENAASFRDIGVDGLAVASAILTQPDIKAAAEELKFMFQKGKSV
jgi:thiamine-phosphate pyrophosphorylase